jgi:glucose dehydrogenase
MTKRIALPRMLGLAAVGGALLLGVLAYSRPSGAIQGKALVRGNAPGEWRFWGADAWSTRYSPLDQINAQNFDSLQVAWQWKAGEFGPDEGEYYRTTPLFANGHLLTVATDRRQAFSLDPATGKVLWHYRLDEGIRWQKAVRKFAGRGLAYWTDGANERAIIVTPGYHLVSLDAKTGKPDPAFGKGGVVDLMEGLGYTLVPLAVDDSGPIIISENAPARRARPGEKWDSVTKTGADGTVGIDPGEGQISNSSPAIVVGNVIVVGNSSEHGYYPVYTHNVPSFIRGFDIKTGKQLWRFNLVPQAGEFGADTWKNGTKIGSPGVGKVDAWATYSADPDLGLVYIPVGEPVNDEYGGHRPGNNLFATSVVAIDVKTGLRKWHFQLVHHDIWDYDIPMAPNLMDVTVNGQPRKIIAVTTKIGWVYTFDRVTGAPIWPMPETPVLQSEVPGEQTSATQPIPSRPAPYSQQGFVEADVIDYTPAIKDSALKLAKRCRMGPYFIPESPGDGKSASGGPPQYTCSYYAPGASGGVNIDGGAAVDPETGMLYVGGQTGLGTTSLTHDPCSENAYSQTHNSCNFPGGVGPQAVVAGAAPAGGGGGGRRGGGAGGRAAGAGVAALPTASPGEKNVVLPSCNPGRGGAGSIGGISIVKPKQMGGVTAYDMNSGDKRWWIPNGNLSCQQSSTDPMFAGVQLPKVAAQPGSQPQVITTKTLVINGTGRSGGAGGYQQLTAFDKATGKQVGAVNIPAVTSAVPMTFMYQGKQYIVFASGSGTNITLTALTLPKK